MQIFLGHTQVGADKGHRLWHNLFSITNVLRIQEGVGGNQKGDDLCHFFTQILGQGQMTTSWSSSCWLPLMKQNVKFLEG